MFAFTNTEVTKAQLIESLEAHRAADRIVKGSYWTKNGAAYTRALADELIATIEAAPIRVPA